MSYIPPEFDRMAFHCPYCHVYAHQRWLNAIGGHYINRQGTETFQYVIGYAASRCDFCSKYTIWHDENMVYPNASVAPLPEVDMPEEIKEDFEEARQVLVISPRSSAALLRLVIEKLCKHLGYSDDTIYRAIGKMVADGLDPFIQKAFDAVRIIGNETVHPGQIDLRDDPDTALGLFKLVNFIILEKITKPRHIQEIYSKLPQGQLEGIEKRDKRSDLTTHP